MLCGYTGMPAGMRYPRIAGAGAVFCPWRIAGAGVGAGAASGTGAVLGAGAGAT